MGSVFQERNSLPLNLRKMLMQKSDRILSSRADGNSSSSPIVIRAQSDARSGVAQTDPRLARALFGIYFLPLIGITLVSYRTSGLQMWLASALNSSSSVLLVPIVAKHFVQIESYDPSGLWRWGNLGMVKYTCSSKTLRRNRIYRTTLSYAAFSV